MFRFSFSSELLAMAAAVLLVGVGTGSAAAQQPAADWIHQFGTEVRDQAFATASDASGVYVGGIIYEPPPIYNDGYIKKYGHDGEELWMLQFDYGQTDDVRDIDTHEGSLYILGRSSEILYYPVLVRKYDSDGDELWSRFIGPSYPDARAISVDTSGVYVTGGGILPLDGDVFVRKYDHDGNELWTQYFGPSTGTPGISRSFSAAAHDTGVVVAGYTYGAFPGYTNLGNADVFVRAYDPLGNVRWTRQFGTAARDGVFGMAAASDGVYVVGETTGALPGQTNAGLEDFYIRKYDFDGNELWTRQFGTDERDMMYGGSNRHVAVDGSGVYVSGTVGDRDFGGPHLGGLDVIARKYSHSGVEQWTIQFGTADTDYDGGGVSAYAGGIYVGGFSWGTFPEEVNAGEYDSFLARFSDNQPPVADAGDSQSLHVGVTVVLDGSGSNDVETATEDLVYAWQFVAVPSGSGAVLSGADTINPWFVPDVPGDYLVSLVVTDEGGLSSEPDEVIISSLNAPPNADAGPDQGTYVGALVTLDGSGSNDPDGDPIDSYDWMMVSAPTGSAATLSNADTAGPLFTPDLPGAYEIELIVSDGYEYSEPDSVTILVAEADDYVCTLMTEALNRMAALDNSSFGNKGNRVSLQNFLKNACKFVQKGKLSEAQHKLEQAAERTDGCALRGAPDEGGGGQGPMKDSIIICPDQDAVYPLITEALDALTP